MTLSSLLLAWMLGCVPCASAAELRASDLAEREIVILVAGDRLAAYDPKVVRSWAEILRQPLPERALTFRVEVLELGRDVPHVVAVERFDRRLRALAPEVVLLAFGGPGSGDANELLGRLETLGKRARAARACTLAVVPPEGAPQTVAERVRALVGELGAEPIELGLLALNRNEIPSGWSLGEDRLEEEDHLAFARMLRRRIVERRAGGGLETRAVSYPEIAGQPERLVVNEGVLREGADPRGGFHTEQGEFVGSGWIEAACAIGAGDFALELDLGIDTLDGGEAGLELGGLYLGLDAKGGRFFLEGPLAGAERVWLEPHRQHFGARQRFAMLVTRSGNELRWKIGPHCVAALEVPGELSPVRLDAGKGTLRVRTFRVRGTLLERAAPPAIRVTLPELDLSAARELQVVVDREPGQYLGHVTMAQLEQGNTLLATYPQGHGRGAIVMKRSEDGGRTWSERLALPPSFEKSQEVPTLFKLGGEPGRERLILFSGLYPILATHSADGGRSWSELAPIGDYGGIVAMGSLERTTHGELLAWFHDDGRYLRKQRGPARFVVYQVSSRDEGRTWSQPRAIVQAPRAHYCEPGSVRSPDGKTLALLLRENSRTRFSALVTSTDEGRTWSAPRELPASLMGDRHTLRYLRDGRLLATFRDMGFDSPWKGDWVAWIGSFDDLLHGREGALRIRFLDNTNAWDCAYPGLEILPDGTIVAVTYGHWTAGEAPYIVAVRLSPEDLARRASAR
ncbi:MAG: exo-alpha-sialidase [Planctomycetes bacterium]|nr:exo-alpha-sialidase [Planctomycetota bacterium]